MNKIRYGQTMECSTEMRMNDLHLLATTWMNLRYIILSQRSQIPKVYDSIDVQFKTGKMNL